MHRISPRPWINGSSAQLLVDQMMRIRAILADASGMMRAYQPHGRDYQIGKGRDAAYKADHAEYLRRLRLVEELSAQYESEAYSISVQETSNA